MATNNINISVWRGSQVPPTIYHKWIKFDEDGTYIGQFTYRDGEWKSDLADITEDFEQSLTEINNTINNVKNELQVNIDNLEEKHDTDITNITNEFNQKIEELEEKHDQDKSDLEDLIQAEEDRATEAEQNLDNKITEETNRATQAEEELAQDILDEQNRAEKAEQQLQENINNITGDFTAHINDKNNPHEVTKEQIGLSNVTNDAQVRRDEMGQPNGVATLDNNGKVPSTQLNGQLAHVFGIDGVATSTTLPSTGVVTGDIYYTTDNKMFYNYNGTAWDAPMAPADDTIYNFRNCDKDGDITRTNILYRWDGKDLVEISESIALGETVGTAYYGEKGAANRQAIESLPANIVDSISDIVADTTSVTVKIQSAVKNGLNYAEPVELIQPIPVASDSQAGVMVAEDYQYINTTVPDKFEKIDNYTINGEKISENPTIAGDNIILDNYILGTSVEQVIPSDTVNVAIGKLQLQINSTAKTAAEELQKHLNDKENPHEVTKEQVGLSNVDNTSDKDKPISDATQEALDTKQDNLVSGNNIKTINGESILGSGDIDFKTIGGQELTGTGEINLKTVNGQAITGTGDIDFKTLQGQELTGTGDIKVRAIKDINGTEQSIFGTDPIETLSDAVDAKVYGRSNGSWIDLTPYLTWYIE